MTLPTPRTDTSSADMEAATAACPVCGDTGRYDFSGRDLMFGLHRRHDYFLCAGCGAVFQHPMPDMQAIASFYPPDYSVFDEHGRIRRLSGLRRAILRRSRGYRHLEVALPIRILAELLSPFLDVPATPEFVQGGRLLDVGCGNGRYLSTMRTLGWQVQGVELSEDGVRICRMADLPVHHGDLLSAALPDAAFDLITVRHVIEHIATPHPFMAELARILKPGGHLLVETPNSEALGRAWFGSNWYANDVPRHLILYSPRNLAHLAGRYGLRQTALSMDTSPKIFLNSLDYVTHNRGKPSKRIRWRRFLARLYVILARRSGRGDTFRITLVRS
jgi:2-polyprenyl-3-methyl-5-hydroxy-6-metoxy-1,4-benzoquinol methylase